MSRLLVHRVKACESADSAKSIVLLLSLELLLLLLDLLGEVLLLVLEVSQVDHLLVNLLVQSTNHVVTPLFSSHELVE